MLHEIVRNTIARQPDMVIVGDLPGDDDRPGTTVHRGVDVVITGLEQAELDERITQLMHDHPRLPVLGITVDGRRAFLFELKPSRALLGDASADGLVAAIRSAASPGAR